MNEQQQNSAQKYQNAENQPKSKYTYSQDTNN